MFAGRTLSVLFIVLSLSWAAPPAKSPQPDEAYRRSYEKWKAEQTDDLKENWLSLVGLFWLKPGANSFGTDSKADIVLTEKYLPPKAGTFQLTDGRVTVSLNAGVAALIDGKTASSGELQSDASNKPSLIQLGTMRMLIIKRGERFGVRVRDTENPAIKNFPGMILYPIDLDYRVTATWTPSDSKRTVDVPNVLGDIIPTPFAGVVKFTIAGQEMTLTDLGGDPAKGLFFVFNDLTSKTDTYPGGRFLDTDPVVDGKVVLDFNRAYNPPCAVTPYATCPLAPKENRLQVRIPVGEKYDRTHWHH